MNRFLIEDNPRLIARSLCDQHIVKMPLEEAQMLCTSLWHHAPKYAEEKKLYRPVHQKHPCTLWAGDSLHNYFWLLTLGFALCREYTFRYNRIHACERILAILTDPPINLKARGKTKHPQAMPDEYKSPSSLQAYRQYYIGEKTRLCVWKKRKIPPFMREAMLLHSLNQKMSA